MQIEQALSILNEKFKYKYDLRYIDKWRILHGEGRWYGDCEDYSLTLMWLAADSNFFKFFWNLISFRFLIWFVKTPTGEGHAIVKYQGAFYDNIQKQATSADQLKQKGYRFLFPMIFPIVIARLILSYTVFRIFKS